MKNILVNGCSFSRGPESWPYYLAEQLNANVVNLAQSGAGNTYIQESTVEELSQRSYDYVIIMWTGLSRLDCRVADISAFDHSSYTSKYQKTRNDWAEKVVEPINDQDYVPDNWVFSCGHINNEKAIAESNLFAGMYKHLDYPQFVYHSLQKIIALQSFLKATNNNYLFTFYQDYVGDFQMYPELCRLLDQQQIYIEDNLNNIAKRHNNYASDNLHPGANAHKIWAELIKDHIDAAQS
jgi:hypothetical protein